MGGVLGLGSEPVGWGQRLSPEHVADPEHVVLPGALPAAGHGGHRLQPHEAPSTLQPAVVAGHHLALVQHWAQPRGPGRPKGQGRVGMGVRGLEMVERRRGREGETSRERGTGR